MPIAVPAPDRASVPVPSIPLHIRHRPGQQHRRLRAILKHNRPRIERSLHADLASQRFENARKLPGHLQVLARRGSKPAPQAPLARAIKDLFRHRRKVIIEPLGQPLDPAPFVP